MKITVKAILEKNIFPADYTRCILSLIKHTYQKSDVNLYKSVYDEEKNHEKNYCFAVRFNNPKFKGDIIELEDREMSICISTCDFPFGIDIYNAFLGMRNKPYPMPDGNSVTVKSARLENHKTIGRNDIIVKMVSPLLVKKHDGKKDYFYSWEDKEFQSMLEESVKITAGKLLNADMADRFIEITPYSPKKTVVYCFGMKITANIGLYRIRGDLDIINLIYQCGIGNKRSAGFGMFEVL